MDGIIEHYFQTIVKYITDPFNTQIWCHLGYMTFSRNKGKRRLSTLYGYLHKIYKKDPVFQSELKSTLSEEDKILAAMFLSLNPVDLPWIETNYPLLSPIVEIYKIPYPIIRKQSPIVKIIWNFERCRYLFNKREKELLALKYNSKSNFNFKVWSENV